MSRLREMGGGLEGWMRGRGKRDESKERERGHSGVKEERGESRLNGLRWVVREKREKNLEESGERVNSDRLWGEKEQYLIFFFCLFIDLYLEY